VFKKSAWVTNPFYKQKTDKNLWNFHFLTELWGWFVYRRWTVWRRRGLRWCTTSHVRGILLLYLHKTEVFSNISLPKVQGFIISTFHKNIFFLLCSLKVRGATVYRCNRSVTVTPVTSVIVTTINYRRCRCYYSDKLISGVMESMKIRDKA
jgi:hypothetical protein